MQLSLSLEKMATEEKIKSMESIWDSLCQDEDSISSPNWHKEVLSFRKENIIDKEFIEWKHSKKLILSKLSEN